MIFRARIKILVYNVYNTGLQSYVQTMRVETED